MKTPLETKLSVYAEAKDLLIEWYGAELAEQGACLYWAQVTMNVLKRRGFRPLLQAGDMCWPCQHDPDPRAVKVFGYEWTPEEPLSRQALEAGQLPEVHIWIGLKETNEIVDFSTRFFKKLATERHALEWDLPDPPLFLWGEPPPCSIYRPRREATLFVYRFMLAKCAGMDLQQAAALI